MKPSLVSSLLSELDASKDNAKTESIIRNIAGTAYIGMYFSSNNYESY